MAAEVVVVEVAYALPERQFLQALEVPSGCTLFEAVVRSGLSTQFPALNLEQAAFGIFGRLVAQPRAQVVQAGDRIEVYRPLVADPKEARRERAARQG